MKTLIILRSPKKSGDLVCEDEPFGQPKQRLSSKSSRDATSETEAIASPRMGGNFSYGV